MTENPSGGYVSSKFVKDRSGLWTPEEVVYLHNFDDVNFDETAHHHTLGLLPVQASPGHHTHDGVNSYKLVEAWFDATLHASLTTGGSSYSNVKYKKFTALNMIGIMGRFTNTSGANFVAGTTIFTLPTGYRPGTIQTGMCTFTNPVAAAFQIDIASGGAVSCQATIGIAQVGYLFCFFKNAGT